MGEKTESVPQTDTGRRVEETKAVESRRFKELGKKAGRKLGKMPFPLILAGYNKSFSPDCLTKTQVPANPKRGCIGAEACPVPVS